MKKALRILVCALLALSLVSCSSNSPDLPNYAEWELADYQGASVQDQSKVLADVAKQLGMDTTDVDAMYNLGYAVGFQLGLGQTIGQAVDYIRNNPSLISPDALPDYSEWKLSDYVQAQPITQALIVKESANTLGVDIYDQKAINALAAALGSQLGQGKNISQAIEAFRSNPALISPDALPDYSKWTFSDYMQAQPITQELIIKDIAVTLGVDKNDQKALNALATVLCSRISQGQTIDQAIEDFKSDPSLISPDVTLPDYVEWRLADYQEASAQVQNNILADIAKQLGVRSTDLDTLYNLNFAIGIQLGLGQSIGQAMDTIRSDPSLISSDALPDYSKWVLSDYMQVQPITQELIIKDIAITLGMDIYDQDVLYNLDSAIGRQLDLGQSIGQAMDAIRSDPSLLEPAA